MRKKFPTNEDQVDREEIMRCKRSPVYMYNKYIRKEGQPVLSEEEFKEMIKKEQSRTKKVDYSLIDDTETELNDLH